MTEFESVRTSQRASEQVMWIASSQCGNLHRAHTRTHILKKLLFLQAIQLLFIIYYLNEPIVDNVENDFCFGISIPVFPHSRFQQNNFFSSSASSFSSFFARFATSILFHPRECHWNIACIQLKQRQIEKREYVCLYLKSTYAHKPLNPVSIIQMKYYKPKTKQRDDDGYFPFTIPPQPTPEKRNGTAWYYKAIEFSFFFVLF